MADLLLWLANLFNLIDVAVFCLGHKGIHSVTGAIAYHFLISKKLENGLLNYFLYKICLWMLDSAAAVFAAAVIFNGVLPIALFLKTI